MTRFHFDEKEPGRGRGIEEGDKNFRIITHGCGCSSLCQVISETKGKTGETCEELQ